MENFQRLIEKAQFKDCRLLIRFDPEEYGEEWGIKFYPEPDDDAHFYSFSRDIETASRLLLDELKGFK